MALWFRLYTEVLDDPKVQLLPAEVFRTWINLLCMAKEKNAGGALPSAKEIAFRIRLSQEIFIQHLSILESEGLIEDGTIHAWEERQYDWDGVDRTNSERQQRYREKRRNPSKNNQDNDLNAVTVGVTGVTTVTDKESNGRVTVGVTGVTTVQSRVEESRVDTEKRKSFVVAEAPTPVDNFLEDAPWPAFDQPLESQPPQQSEHSQVLEIAKELHLKKTGELPTIDAGIGKNVKSLIKTHGANNVISKLRAYYQSDHWHTAPGKGFHCVKGFITHFDTIRPEQTKKPPKALPKCPICGDEYQPGLDWCSKCKSWNFVTKSKIDFSA